MFLFTNTNFELKNSVKVLGPDGVTLLPDYIKQALVGLLLGDGILVKKYKGGGTYFQYAQGEIQESYINYVFNLFYQSNYCNMLNPSKKVAFNKKTGNSHKYLCFNTKSLVEFNELIPLFYLSSEKDSLKRTKIVPQNIFDLLNPIGLAFWLMDDGGWTGKGIHLNSNYFLNSEVELLSNVLKIKFGLKCSTHSRNRIYIWADSAPKFIELVKPHIASSMLYKIKIV